MGTQPVALIFMSTILGLGTACGGVSDGGDRLSREGLIEQGDAICREYESRIAEVEAPANDADIARYVDEVKPIMEEGAAKLDELTPPEELEDDYRAWIERGRAGMEPLDDLKAAAAEGDDARMEEITNVLRDDAAEADRIAQDIGFQKCGE